MSRTDICLHCGEYRQAVRQEKLICGIMSGYEYPELDFEFPSHRWADWKDRDLKVHGIKPEAYDKYRRSSLYDLEYAECDDKVTGHRPAQDDDPKYGFVKGVCMDCGQQVEEKTNGYLEA